MDLNLTKEQVLRAFAMLPPFGSRSVKEEVVPVYSHGIKRELIFKKDYSVNEWVLSEINEPKHQPHELRYSN